jgi:hypothetical protein
MSRCPKGIRPWLSGPYKPLTNMGIMQTYRLTLTRDERSAIDWIGDRYWNGDTLSDLLWSDYEGDVEWDDDKDITFSVPWDKAQEIAEYVEDEFIPCFDDELTKKINMFAAVVQDAMYRR